MPLIITARRRARTTEPNIKSSGTGSNFFMQANAKHELKFHCITLDTVGGKQQHLGYFTTLADAAAAYETAANDNFGEFARVA